MGWHVSGGISSVKDQADQRSCSGQQVENVGDGFTLLFTLEVDSSFNGIGAVLSQQQEGGRVVIRYASSGLRPNERNMENYSSMKLELLGLKWAITEKFRDYLIGSRFIVRIDNNPLTYVQSTAKLGTTEMRWVAELAQFNFTFEFKSGRLNKNGDALSRKVQHGKEPSAVRFEGLCAGFLQGKAGTAGFPLPTVLRKTLEGSITEVWLEEVQDRPKRVPELCPSTLPAMPRQELARLQRSDSHIGPVVTFWRQK